MAKDTRGSFDIEILADKTMNMLSISSGQVIWIWASTYSLDLVDALAYRIRARGAFWTLRLRSERLLQRIGQSAPEDCLALVPEHELRWLTDIDAIIEVRDSSWHALDIPLARRHALGAEWRALLDEAARRGCRRVTIINPTPALAAAFHVPLAVLQERYWRAVNVDYAAVDKQMEQVGALLAKSCYVHVTSPLGTDLHLRIDQRPINLDTNGIPRGEVYVAPHEDSANGVAVIDRAHIRGQSVQRLQLTFARGRVVQIDAPDPAGVRLLQELLAVCSGDKDVIAEFAIALNPGISEPIGDILLDEHIGGSVHIAIGMNEQFGGKNRSDLHMDLVVLHPTVWLDQVLVVNNGILSRFCGVDTVEGDMPIPGAGLTPDRSERCSAALSSTP